MSGPQFSSSLESKVIRINQGLERLSYQVDLGFTQVLQAICELYGKENKIMATLADITSAVEAESSVEKSVEVLLTHLSSDLSAAIAANDPAAMQHIVDMINQNAAALTDAVTKNTPASAEPTPAPTPAAPPDATPSADPGAAPVTAPPEPTPPTP